MYELKFTTKYGKEVSLKDYQTKELAERHGKLLLQCREAEAYEVIDNTSKISDTSLVNTENGEPENGV